MDKVMMKNIIHLSIPVIIEYALQTLMNYVDYIMVGSLGTYATAAVGLTSEVTWLLKGTVNALSIGVLAYISFALGLEHKDKIKTASMQAVFTSIIVGVIMMTISLMIAPFVPLWLGAEENIAIISGRYFAISNSSFIFLSLNVVLGSAFKAVGSMKKTLYVNGAVNIINIILNYLLINNSRDIFFNDHYFHIYGAGLGVYGAAIGTSVSTALGGILMFIVFFSDPVLSPKSEKKHIDRSVIREFTKVGIPSMLTRLTNSGGRVIFTAIVAHLGTLVYSAHTISFTAESAFYIPCVGMMSVAAAMAGRIKGEGDIDKLNRLTKTFCLFAFGVMLIMAVLMFILSDVIISFFTDDNTVISTASVLLRIVAVNEPLFAVSIILESIFNGIGRTKLPFIANTISQWTFRVGGSLICINVFGLSIKAAWVCMISDNIIRCIILSIEYLIMNKQLIEPCHSFTGIHNSHKSRNDCLLLQK